MPWKQVYKEWKNEKKKSKKLEIVFSFEYLQYIRICHSGRYLLLFERGNYKVLNFIWITLLTWK